MPDLYGAFESSVEAGPYTTTPLLVATEGSDSRVSSSRKSGTAATTVGFVFVAAAAITGVAVVVRGGVQWTSVPTTGFDWRDPAVAYTDDSVGDDGVTSATFGVTKCTWATSNTTKTLAWLLQHFDSYSSYDSCTNNACSCGSTQGRIQLNSDSFGIHTVNTAESHCTDSNVLSVEGVEALFNKKMFSDGKGDFSQFDSFMDYNLGLWFAGDLDNLAKEFDKWGTKYFVLSWNASFDFGTQFYSLITYIPETQVVFEFMGNETNASGYIREEVVHPTKEQRLSDTNIGIAIEYSHNSVVQPVKVSRATSNLTRDMEMYHSLSATEVMHQVTPSESLSMAAFSWPFSNIEIQFWERPDSQTLGEFTVLDYETKLKRVHSTCLQSEFCGFDEWFDNHYAYDGFTYLDEAYEVIKKQGHKFFIWKLDKNATVAGVDAPIEQIYSMYFIDGTGYAVQLDGMMMNKTYVAGAPMYNSSLCGDGSC